MNYEVTENSEYDFENRMVAPEYTPEDAEVENPLRPKRLNEYIGQDKVKENLSVFIEAARLRKNRWTTCCFTDRRALAKPPLQA